jgi:hypothetical protein
MNLEHEAEELVTVALDEGGWLSPTKLALWYTLQEAKLDGFIEALTVFRGMPVYHENIAYAAEFEQRLLRRLNDITTELKRLKMAMERKGDEPS